MKFFQVKSVEETFSLIEELIHPLTDRIVLPLHKALNYILAEDIVVKENVPGFRRSSVDGYAVIAKDTFGSSENMPGFLNVAGEVKMGEAPQNPLSVGEAIYIPTGGMLPDGSDAVILIEHCEVLSGLLNLYRQVAPGENVISIGEDMKAGESLVTTGTKLRPQELGALASQGITEVSVYRKPVVGYLSTGDEIVPIETKDLGIGQVRDMNGITIGSLVSEWGCEFLYGGIVKDDQTELERVTAEMLEKTDCLILSGGSSVGTKDYSVEVIDRMGKPGVFVHGVSIKPGKPTILASADGKPIIGLPGHPASAMIIFNLFGKAVLHKLQGWTSDEKNLAKAIVTKNLPSTPGRTDFVRARLFLEENQWYADPILGKSSLISTLVKSEGMIEIPSKSEGVLKGETVSVRLFR